MTQGSNKGWLEKNWKWVLPVGCVGTLLVVAALIVSLAVALFSMFRSSDVYAGALEQAIRHPEVIAALGEPVEPGWMVSGSMSVTAAPGEADLAIPLGGPNGQGGLYVVGEKSAGEWTFERLEVRIDGQPDRIDLLNP